MGKYILAIMFLFSGSSSMAQTNDPYAEDINQLNEKNQAELSKQTIDSYLNKISALSYAVNCQVLDRSQETIVLGNLQAELFTQLNRNNLPYDIEKFKVENQAAYDYGKHNFKENGCEFWHKHPDFVKDVRDFSFFY